MSDGSDSGSVSRMTKRNVPVLGLTSMFSTFSLSLWQGYLSVYLVGFGFSKAYVGLIYSIGGAAAVAAFFVAGWLGDRLGRKAVIVISTLTLALSCSLLAIPYPATLISGMLLFNWSTSALLPVFRALITESVHSGARGSALGLFNSLAVGLGAAAVLIAGAFVNSSSVQAYTSKLPLLFLFGAGVILIVTFVRWVLLVETHTTRTPLPLEVSLQNSLKPLTQEKLQPLTVAYMVHDGGLSLVLYLIPIYAVTFLHATSLVLAFMIALNYLVTLALQAPFGKLADKLGRTKMITLSFFIEAFAIGSLVLVRNLIYLIVIYGVWVAIGQMDQPAEGALLADLSEKESRASVMGSFAGVTTMAAVPAAAVGGFLADLHVGYAAGYGLPFYVSFVLIFFSALMMLFYRMQTFSG